MRKILAVCLTSLVCATLMVTSVFAETIQFGVGGDDEAKYLYKNDADVDKGGTEPLRFADNDKTFTYKFDLDDNATTAKITMKLSNHYIVSASSDENTWTELMKAKEDSHDHTNQAEQTFDLASFLKDNASKVVYVKVGDASPDTGWGGAVASVSLEYGAGDATTEEAKPAETNENPTTGDAVSLGYILAAAVSGVTALRMRKK